MFISQLIMPVWIAITIIKKPNGITAQNKIANLYKTPNLLFSLTPNVFKADSNPCFR